MYYKCVRQYDSTDCGCACLASIAWYYGRKIALSEIVNKSYVGNEGMNLLEIVNVSKEIGLNAVPMKKTENFQEADISLPCIAHVLLANGMFHYVVIFKIGKKKVTIGDPAIGICKVNKESFFGVDSEICPQYKWLGILIFFTPDKEFKTNKIRVNEKLIWKLIVTEKNALLKIVFLTLLSMLCKVIGSFYFQIVLDKIIPNRWLYTLIIFSIGFILIGSLGVFLDKICVNEALKVSKDINNKLSINYYSHVMQLPLSFHDVKKSGEIISRFQDIDKIQKMLITSILVLPVDIVFITVIGILLVQKSIGIFCLVVLMCIIYVFIVIVYRKKYDYNNTKQMEEEANVTTHLVDTLEGVATIKAYNIEKPTVFSGKEKIKTWQETILMLGSTENNQSALKTLVNRIGELCILALGAYAVINGSMTMGELITYNVLIGYILSPIQNIIDLQPQLHSAITAIGRLSSILDVVEETYSGVGITEINSIESNHVKFGYSKYYKIIDDVTFAINKCNKVAIIGNSGSGKTTIAKLLMQLYLPKEGNITFNNLKNSVINPESIRQRMVYVSQEDFIFSCSVKENLILGDDTISFDEIIKICKQTGVHEFVMNMQRQYDTLLEERGINLSKGQRQKIALSRALLKKPQVLILDEATSNIDTISEQKIFNLISNIKELTLIVITHRMNCIIDSDLIYVLEHGKIIAQGKHSELMNNCGLYKEYLARSNRSHC